MFTKFSVIYFSQRGGGYMHDFDNTHGQCIDLPLHTASWLGQRPISILVCMSGVFLLDVYKFSPVKPTVNTNLPVGLHCSVDSSRSTSLPSRVQIPSTSSMLFHLPNSQRPATLINAFRKERK